MTDAVLYLFGALALFCIGAACLESWLDWRNQRRIAAILARVAWLECPRSEWEPWTGGRKHWKGGA